MAVYTAIDDASLEAFLAAYDIGRAVSLQGITEGVENSNFLLITERGRFILTLYERRVDPADLPFFLGLMDHLAGKGVPCPTPVHGGTARSCVACAVARQRSSFPRNLAATGPTRPLRGARQSAGTAASGRRQLRHGTPQLAIGAGLAIVVRGLPRRR